MKSALIGGIAGALLGGLLGQKWVRKAQKIQAHADAMEALANVGDETEPLPLVSELQVEVPGQSGDAFAPSKIVWQKVKQGKRRGAGSG